MYWTVGLSMAQLSLVVVLMVVIPTSISPKSFPKLRRMEPKTTSLHLTHSTSGQLMRLLLVVGFDLPFPVHFYISNCLLVAPYMTVLLNGRHTFSCST